MLPELFLAAQFHFDFDLNIVGDAALHPMVEEALADQGPLPAYEDNAHVYLMGVVAAKADDSFEVGKQRFIAMNELHTNGERKAYEGYPKTKWSKVKDEPRLCKFSGEKAEQIACFNKLNKSCAEMDALLTQYQVSVGSYRRVLGNTEIRSPSDRSMTDFQTLEEFRALGMLAGMSHRFEFQCSLKGDHTEVIADIDQQAKALRVLATETDDLILKVMFQIVLRDFYRWQVYNYRNNTPELRQLPDSFFTLQTREESSLRKVLFREIANNAQMLENAYTEGLNDDEDYWKVSLFFKKNLTTNDATLSYRHAVLDSELPINRYVQDRNLPNLNSTFKWWRITNLVGEFMNAVPTPRFLKVAVDMNNLDLIIRLSDIAINYSELVDNNQLSSLPLSKRNPYDNSLPYFDESGKWLCFKVPEELKTQDECIYLN
ncbi:hypothetical protein ACMXYV_14990 [Neptuniibacter sp. SY11_33]|uniref:hypothetical protein n=1 Tax=Neptuniibacter sp. SY11_33 TaxID=3398215 RepID=UPI0039F5A3D2